MKINFCILLAAVILLSGCTTPVADAVKIDGENNYTLTVIGDTHFDGPEYHISEPQSENGKKERRRKSAFF